MDQAGFKEIWLPLEDTFCKVASYILEDAADARDAVQDLYVKLWNGRDREILNPKAYGITLLRNLCLDRLRQRKAGRQGIETEPESPGNGPDSPIISKETLKALDAAMERLPEKMRDLLEMRAFHEMGYDEIAKETGMSEVNVRVHVSKARKLLRKYIER